MATNLNFILAFVVVVVWKSIHSRSDTNRNGAEGLSFYYPRLLYWLDQMFDSNVVKPASSFVIQNRQTSCSMWCTCIGHAVKTWSAVCSAAPHLQFGERASPHLCLDEWSPTTPGLKRLSLTQAARKKPIQIGLAPVLGTKTRRQKAFYPRFAFHLRNVHSEARMPNPENFFKRFREGGTNGCWILVSLDEHLRTDLKDHTRYDQGQEIYGKPKKVSLPFGEAQLAGCLIV